MDGFHEPVFRNPHRKSGRGGGLVIYVNKEFCDSGDVENLSLDDPISIEDENEPNPPGEFLFVSIEYKVKSKNLIKNRQKLIVGNIYRSPSSNHLKFIERLGNQ